MTDSRAARSSRMTIWLTSDTHFGHARIIELCERPYATVSEMDEQLIAAHNTLVHPDDLVLHLGDLCLGPFQQSLDRTAQLNGRRFLVPGNHDRVSGVFDKGKNIDRYRGMYEDAGWTVLPENIEIELDGIRFAVSHYPYQGDHTDTDRYASARPVDTGLVLLHGHIHGLRRTEGRMLNVGVDVNGYRPVPAQVAVGFARTLPPALSSAAGQYPFFDVRTGECHE